MLLHNFRMCFDGSFANDWRCLSLSTNWRDRSSHSQWNFSIGHLLDHWEYLDFLMLLTETTMMAHHREEWQCSWQNRVIDLQGMEWRMEVQVTMQVRRLRRQCSPPPWQSYIPSWSALVHVSFSVDCGWTSPVKLKIHMRIDAENLVTAARTIHLLEQKETIHMISMFRKEACTGSIHDPAHMPNHNCLSDCVTEADNLIISMKTGKLLEADIHPDF